MLKRSAEVECSSFLRLTFTEMKFITGMLAFPLSGLESTHNSVRPLVGHNDTGSPITDAASAQST